MKGKTILLVEDDPLVMRNNTAELKYHGAKVLSASTLVDARALIGDNAIDAAVLDIMLPDGSGLDLLREIRTMSDFPVLMLTAKGESEDVVEGLSGGADDYLAKPYYLNVLTARIETLLRRARTIDDNAVIGPLRFDMLKNQALVGEKDLHLTHKEFALLFLLAQNERKTLTAHHLYEKVWGQPLNKDTSALRFQMSNLSKKITSATENIIIETFYNEGYCLTIFR